MIKTIEKPWGREEIWADVEGKYLGKYLVIEPGGELSTQYHVEKDETVMCVEGEVWILIREDEKLMRPGVPIHIPAGTVHKMYCKDNTGGRVLEVSTYHPKDVVRLQDKYGREDSK